MSIVVSVLEALAAVLIVWGIFHEKKLAEWESLIGRYLKWRFSKRGRRYRKNKAREQALRQEAGRAYPKRDLTPRQENRSARPHAAQRQNVA